MVRELYESGGARIDKKGRIGYILQRTPPGSGLAEFPTQFLQRSLACGFVQDDQTSLLVALLTPPPEEIIESLAEILEGHFNRIRVGKCVFLDSAREEARGDVTCRRDFENGFQNAAGFVDSQGLPWRLTAGENRRSVELDVFWILVVGCGELVHLAAEPIDLRFKDADPAQREIFLGGIPRRPRVVEVEEITKMRGEKEKAAERIFIRRTAKAALSTAAS
jgi:hypothetical protein